MDKRGKNVG